MELDRVEIKNFRSIKKQTFTFEKNFQIMVGINETGKSNFIKALSFLDKSKPLTKNDIRDIGHDEDPINESYISFIFKTDEELNTYAFETIKKTILTVNIDFTLITIAGKKYTLKDFINYIDEVLYKVDIYNKTKRAKYWILPKNLSTSINHKAVKKGTKYTFEFNNKVISLSDYKIVNIDVFDMIPSSELENLDAEMINGLIGMAFCDKIKDRLPDTILWEYNDENLLPGKINIEKFAENPEQYKPLFNMFALAGFNDPSRVIKEVKDKSNGIANMLRKISDNTTKLMKAIWPEWKNKSVSLLQNGEVFETGIEDEFNVYSLDRRSDGFKRFFTFLLMISAKNKTDDIVNNLILMDEPDIGLHPTGVNYLREELARIAIKNKVLVSTHSIFMIDKIVLDRHLIVDKTNEITTFKKIDHSNILDEEVVYNALNFSMFDVIKPFNIIFEGWKDKKTFEMYLRSNKGKKLIPKEYKNSVGLMYGVGVKDIQRVANFCENISRNYIIISDSDAPAKERQNKFIGSGKWYCYDDIENISAITTEDFISNKLINSMIKKVFKEKCIELDYSLKDTDTSNKLTKLDSELGKYGINKEDKKVIIHLIKDYVCENTKATNLENEYDIAYKFIIDELLK